MAGSTKNQLEQDIRSGAYSRVYLLYGEEDYLKSYYRKRLTAALIPPDNSINLNVWNEDKPDVGQVMEQALTMPFFAEHRLLILLRSGFFKGTAGQALADRLEEIPPETVLLFVEKDVDERCRLFKAVSSKGVAQKCARMKEKELEKWVMGRLLREGRTRIQTSAMRLFLERTGDDLQTIDTELEKLISYTQGRDTLLEEDVKAVVTVQLENQIFQMVDLIASRSRDEVLNMYRELLLLKVKTGTILWRLSSQFMRLLTIRELRDQGLDAATIAQKTGNHIYAVRKAIGQCTRFTPRELIENLKRLEQADEDIKFGRMGDVMAVEQAILWITRKE